MASLNNVPRIASWTVCGLITVGAVATALDGKLYFSIFLALTGVAFLPPVLDALARWRGEPTPIGPRLIAVFVLLGLGGATLPLDLVRIERAAEAARIDSLATYFDTHQAGIFAEIEALVRDGSFDEAKERAAKYQELASDSLAALVAAADAGIEEAAVAAEEARLVSEVRGVPASETQRNLVLYRGLLALRPNNETYAERVDHYHAVEVREAERAREALEAARRREEARKERAVASMRVNRDDMRGINFYTDPASPRFVNSRSNLHFYISHRPGSPPTLRAKLTYKGRSWVFFRTAYIRIGEDVTRFSFSHFDVERDNGYGGVWEWVDEVADGSWRRVAETIATKGGPVRIRFEGDQYYREFTMSGADVAAVGRVLDVWQYLQDNPSRR
jgi:hypothetical protein